MASQEHFGSLRSEEKRRYIADKAPHILCALIGRRASTNPLELVDTAIDTAALLYERLTPVYLPGNGRISDADHPVVANA